MQVTLANRLVVIVYADTFLKLCMPINPASMHVLTTTFDPFPLTYGHSNEANCHQIIPLLLSK